MSVAMSRSDGVTVLTLTSDPSSACPPCCQLLGALCYSPTLCSVSRRLTLQRGGAQSALGALWIITGVLHIGLGATLLANWTWAPFMDVLVLSGCSPAWLGASFVFVGVSCVLAERYPRPIGVLLSGLLNLTAGVALPIAGIVLYSLQLSDLRYSVNCERHPGHRGHYDYDYGNPTPAATTLAPDQDALEMSCEAARGIMRDLFKGVLAVLIALSALDLGLGLSSATLSFRSLKRGESGDKNKNKATTEK